VELRGEDLSCYLNSIRSVGLWNVCMITNLPTKRISATLQWKTFIRVLPTRWRRKPASIDIMSLSPYVASLSSTSMQKDVADVLWVNTDYPLQFWLSIGDWLGLIPWLHVMCVASRWGPSVSVCGDYVSLRHSIWLWCGNVTSVGWQVTLCDPI